jgi:hypothetical protein
MIKLIFTAAAITLASCAAPQLTYDDVVTLPPEAQLAVLKSASPEERTTLFREHYRHLAAHPELTEAQRAAARRAVAEITTADFTPREPVRSDFERRERAERDIAAEQSTYVGAIREAFGPQAGRVLYSLQ